MHVQRLYDFSCQPLDLIGWFIYFCTSFLGAYVDSRNLFSRHGLITSHMVLMHYLWPQHTHTDTNTNSTHYNSTKNRTTNECSDRFKLIYNSFSVPVNQSHWVFRNRSNPVDTGRFMWFNIFCLWVWLFCTHIWLVGWLCLCFDWFDGGVLFYFIFIGLLVFCFGRQCLFASKQHRNHIFLLEMFTNATETLVTHAVLWICTTANGIAQINNMLALRKWKKTTHSQYAHNSYTYDELIFIVYLSTVAIVRTYIIMVLSG